MPTHPERQYLGILSHLLANGDRRMDRTGEGTLSMFGATMRFDLSDGSFPVLTTKKVYWKTSVKEMLWFITGDTNIRNLLRQNVTIWTDWPLANYRARTGDQVRQQDFERRIVEDEKFASQWGDLGPVYGKQWRRWVDAKGEVHDQIANVLHLLKTNPTSRRILFHGWNVGELDRMALPPCHMSYQFYVSGLGDHSARPKLSMMVHQRSCDIFLGAPFNICQQAALLSMVAHQCGMDRGELIWFGGDTHLYLNHLDQAKEQLGREPHPFPKLELARRPDTIDGYTIEDFVVSNYRSHERIEAPVAV